MNFFDSWQFLMQIEWYIFMIFLYNINDIHWYTISILHYYILPARVSLPRFSAAETLEAILRGARRGRRARRALEAGSRHASAKTTPTTGRRSRKQLGITSGVKHGNPLKNEGLLWFAHGKIIGENFRLPWLSKGKAMDDMGHRGVCLKRWSLENPKWSLYIF